MRTATFIVISVPLICVVILSLLYRRPRLEYVPKVADKKTVCAPVVPCSSYPCTLEENAVDLKEILSHLSTAHRHVRSGKAMLEIQSAYHKTWKLLNAVHRKQEARVLEKPRLDIFQNSTIALIAKADISLKVVNGNKTKIRVCPETYSSMAAGVPLMLTGVDTVNCSNEYDVIPLEESVTIWLNFANEISNSNQKVLLDDLSKSNYSHLPIIVTAMSNVSTQFGSVLAKLPNLTSLDVDSDSIGEAMKKAAESVKTPYILVSRSLERFTQFANIERLLRITSYLNIDFVGGSQRRLDGHWMHSCYQYKMLNYTLRIVSGYDVSYNACMHCDYTSAPFLSTPKILLDVMAKNPPIKGISKSAIRPHLFYLDFFMKTNRKYSTMSCSDVMFHTTDIGLPGKDVSRLDWKPLISKWRLNRLILSNGVDWSYSCAESDTKCTLVFGLLNPICCTAELNEALIFTAQFMDKYDIEYTIYAGTLLGSIKVASSFSWERDHDVRVRRTDFKKFYDTAAQTKVFEKHGYKLDWEKCEDQKQCVYHSVHLFTKNWRLDFFAKWRDCNPNDLWNSYSGNITKSRAQMGDYWLIAYPNPPGAARNMYGPTLLEHSEHSGSYGEGTWHKCPEPGFHGCLDNFLPMGNIQFKEVSI